jgi:hypothetical protein
VATASAVKGRKCIDESGRDQPLPLFGEWLRHCLVISGILDPLVLGDFTFCAVERDLDKCVSPCAFVVVERLKRQPYARPFLIGHVSSVAVPRFAGRRWHVGW